jgi:hypothetical protein
MSSVEFLVHETHEEAGNLVVGGIVSKGDVAKGMIFTLVRAADSGERRVELVVTKITAYRRELDELPKGVSGGLFLVGLGANLLKRHDKLEA